MTNDALEALCETNAITCSELALFEACVAWTKEECKRQNLEETSENQQRVLGNVVKKIRFPVIPLKDIDDKIVPLKILSHEEMGRLVYEIRTKKKETEFSNVDRTSHVEVCDLSYYFIYQI